MMFIKDVPIPDEWVDKKFKGKEFNFAIYGPSLKECEEMGVPYALSCFHLTEDILVGIGVERNDQSPLDFMQANHNRSFKIDHSKDAVFMEGKTILFAKKLEINQEELELDFVFHSSDHLRHENGEHISGPHGGAPRAVQVQKNITGGKGYTVTVLTTDGDQAKIQLAPKQMKLVSYEDDKIILTGFGSGAFGHSFKDYGLSIYHSNGRIEKCVMHWHDRNIDIEYLP